MKRTIFALVLAVGATAYAGNVHLKPPKDDPTFIDQGLALKGSAALAGLGNGDVVITMIATADVTATCANNGGHQAPGQNPAPITVAGATAIPASEIKNGNTPFMVTTNPPESPIPGAPDCPNPNWDEEITDLAFTSAEITVNQAGTDVLVVTCSFDPPTAHGLVDEETVVCQVL